MAYISPEACESGLRLKTSHCDICVTFTQRVPTRCSRRWQVRLWFAKSGGSRVLNPRMDTQEQDLQNSQSIEAGDTRMLQLHSTHTGFRMFFSQLLQNALNIVFVLNIVWYIYNLSQIYLLYFIFMREGCNKFCACSFMWAPISDRYYVSSRQKYRMRFRCTSMRQTLVTDRGRPKNQYPDKLSVLVSCAKPVALSISLQPSVRALRTGNIWWIGGMYLHTDAFTPIDQWMIEC